MSNDCTSTELDIVLSPDHGNTEGTTHSALFCLMEASLKKWYAKLKMGSQLLEGNDSKCEWGENDAKCHQGH